MVFKNDFFKEEIRSGFLVPSLMKRAWAAEMEVLQVVADICTRHDIMYFADGGTLLGAVRHQGFIPWDDDIDITLKRPDYNRLISYLRTELPPGFVMTGMYSDDEKLQAAASVPNIRVMADGDYWDFFHSLQRFHAFPFFCIGIDIFPLDYIPRDLELSNLQQILLQHIYCLLMKENKDRTDFNEKELQKIEQIETLCGVTLPKDHSLKNSLWKLADSISSLYTYEDADYMTEYPYWISRPQFMLRKECFDECMLLPFENIFVPAPKKYHEVLTAGYGDYQTPVMGGSEHDYPFYAAQEQALSEILRQKGITQSIPEFCDNFAKIYHCDL